MKSGGRKFVEYVGGALTPGTEFEVMIKDVPYGLA